MEVVQEPVDATIASVKRAMVRLGIDPEAVSFSYQERESWVPSGRWTHVFLRATDRTGRCLDMAAHLVDASPMVAAADISRFLNAAQG